MAIDWSGAGAKQRFQNFTADPNQALSNPWMQMGMGLLSSSYDGSNPFQAAMGGLAGAKQTKQEDEDRKRIEELRAELQKLIEEQKILQQQAAAGRQPNPVSFPGAQSPTFGPQPPQQQSFFPGILN